MKRILARIIYYVGCVCAGAFAATLIGAFGWAYWLDIQAGNWWHLPVAGLCALGIAVIIGLFVRAVFWAIENK